MRLYHLAPLNLYVRGAFSKRSNRVTALRTAGIDVVYCLLRTRDDQLAVAYGDAYKQRPLPDARVVPVERARAIAREVIGDLRAGRRVLVHCVAGRNRTGIVTALVMMSELGIDGRAAVARFRAARGPVGLDNPIYASWLESLAAGWLS